MRTSRSTVGTMTETQRSPEAAVRACRAAALPALRPRRAPRQCAEHCRRAGAARRAAARHAAAGVLSGAAAAEDEAGGAACRARQARLCALPSGRAETADRHPGSAAPGNGRSQPPGRGARSGAACGSRPRQRARARSRRRRARGAAILGRPALCRLRPALSGRHAGSVLIQLTGRRLRRLPRLRPRHRHRLRTGRAGQQQITGGRRHPAVADAFLSRNARTTCCGSPKSAASRLDVPWRALDQAQRRLGHRGRRTLEQEGLVRRAALLRVAREPRLQDAHPRAAVEVPQLHALRRLPRCPPQAGRAAVAARCAGRGGTARVAVAGAAGSADRCRHAAADRALPRVLRTTDAAAAAGCRPRSCCSANCARA